MKQCSIDGCEKPRKARGWCGKHWERWRRHGDPLGAAYRGPEGSFEARTERDGECIIWTGYVHSRGYGQIWIGGRYVGAHRYAWERAHGPVPEGMFIDHVCWNKACVNPRHLRLATPAENSRNLSGARSNRRHALPRGVHRHGRGYMALVCHNGQQNYLGTFDTPEEASAAAQTKRALLFGEYAGGA